MFVKKLVEKASIKKINISTSEGSYSQVKCSDVEPRLVFHHGIPCGSSTFAYDPLQRILAISTNDGRIKLFGRDNNSQAVLESKEANPTKFLQFFHSQGFLVNVTSKNNIEVWDIENKILCDVYTFQQEITSFTVIQQSAFMYIGDSTGNVSVLKLEKEPCRIVQANYTIPFVTSHGSSVEVSAMNVVTHVLPQPMAESERVLIIFRDGFITLFDIRESKSIFTTGGNQLQLLHHEATKVTSACWACPSGSRVFVGYNNGEIFLWGISPYASNSKTGFGLDTVTQNTPICKLNIGYKLNKTPIASLKWSYGDGKASRLYVLGASNSESESLSQVVLLNEHTESRIIKLAIHLPEPCNDMDIVSGYSEQRKHRQDCFLLVGKSGHFYAYDDNAIEKYLIQCQSRSHPAPPNEVMVKIPFSDSSITVSKLVTDNQCLGLSDEDYVQMAKELPQMFSIDAKTKDGSNLFSGFSRVKNLYITGHANGAITFWDISTPNFVPILSLKQQSEDDSSPSGIAVTALFFDINSRLLVSGDQSGMVRIYKLKSDQYATDNSFLSLQANAKKGNSHIVDSIKLIKINGSILCINISQSSKHLAVGSDQGYVSVINLEGPKILYQQRIETDLSTGIISLQFVSCNLHGFGKNVLAVATKDSSLLAIDSDTGDKLSTSLVHPKKPYKALFMHILNGIDCGPSKGKPTENGTPKQPLLLLCSEKALYLYSFTHVVQGVKKVISKKKFQFSCCYAATFTSSSGVALLLLFTNGRIEIRSLPELSMIKESLIRGFAYSNPKPNSLSSTSISSSTSGDIVMVNDDQEIFVISVLSHRKLFRLLEHSTQIYQKDLVISHEGNVSTGQVIPKEKKKGLFSSVIKDITGNKSKPVPDPMEAEDTRKKFQELEAIFSTANFLSHVETTIEPKASDHKELELDIDDIDIDSVAETPSDKPKEQNILSGLYTQNLASKVQGLIKGKIKNIKPKNGKTLPKEEEQEEKADTVDQIKKKYGFAKTGETTVAKIAESKLQEGVTKLQGINERATQMQDTAKSFSYYAKQMLQTQQDRRAL